MNVGFGIQLHPQYTTWPEIRGTARLIDELGYDWLTTWDHFVPLIGDATGPNFEGWQILPALGASTTRVKLGMLVTGNTYRHPAVLANMAATFDHITEGRAILGIGAAWHEAEHKMYGIPFDTAPIRLQKLREAVPIIRSLLDQPRTTFAGTHYTITDATCEPKPIQKRLPIMIGGGGEQVTLKITASFADIWHGFGTADVIAHKLEVLKRHCETVKRDYAAILPTTGGSALVRDTQSAIDARLNELRTHHRQSATPNVTISGTPDGVAKHLLERWRAGARGFIFGISAPYDHETIERLMREVKPKLLELIG
ncbi:MAG: TIGR03560 family F420-dependent LLM class oxidoreductase [Chloroflexi bacterium]|nr:TIGR03560 family F420-dependent LLM class oxidoreductase [Chloroflexota bacterium]